MKKNTMKLEEILAKNLNRLMSETVGLDTNDKVALRSGVGRGTVDRLRKAEASAKIETIDLLAAAFGVSPVVLLSEADANQEPADTTLAPESTDSVSRQVLRNAQWVTVDEEELLTAYRTTDDDGRRTVKNIASIVPKVLFATFGRDKAE